MKSVSLIKRITAIVLVSSWSCIGMASADLTGDINNDNTTDKTDVNILRNTLLNIETDANADLSQADYNGNGKADIFDYVTIKDAVLSRNTLTRKIYVNDVAELNTAMKNAAPGDEIILKSGVYESEISHTKGSLFISTADGTKDRPITIRSESADNKAQLKGTDTANKIVLYITGDYWRIEDLDISTAQKGIVLDNSSHSIISGCEVYNTGSEGIHLRDDSSYNTVRDCSVHHNGVVSPSYGEAVYIGSAKSTTGYGYDCSYNTIAGCKLGPFTAAEHVDIKEFTTGNIVENCIFDGEGMSGANYADSFVDVKGNECVIKSNTGYRKNNPNITEAVQLHVQADGWGENNIFCSNIFYMDDDTCYITKAWSGSVTVYDNIRYPEGNMYDGSSVTQENK